MQLTGIHHLTAISAKPRVKSPILHPRPRDAAGQEDGQSGRCQRLSPVLCGWTGQSRHRPDLLRFPGWPRTPRQQQHFMHGTARRRPEKPGVLERSPEAGGRSPQRSGRGRRPVDAAVRGSGGPAPDAGRRRRRRSGLALGAQPGAGRTPDPWSRSDRAQRARRRRHRTGADRGDEPAPGTPLCGARCGRRGSCLCHGAGRSCRGASCARAKGIAVGPARCRWCAPCRVSHARRPGNTIVGRNG